MDYNQNSNSFDNQDKTAFNFPYVTFEIKRMSFGLSNAPATFQQYMISIFFDMVEETIEVFMDIFSVVGDSFDWCLSHLCLIGKNVTLW